MKKIGSAKKAKHEANKYVFVPVLTDEVKWREPMGKGHASAMLKAILERRGQFYYEIRPAIITKKLIKEV